MSPWTEPRLSSDYVSEGEVRDRADPPRGPSGISPDPVTLDPIRAHALLCAATYLAPLHGRLTDLPLADVVACADFFERYLRGEPS